MTETPKTTETNNLPYEFEFEDLTDDDVPDSEGQGRPYNCSLINGLPKILFPLRIV